MTKILCKVKSSYSKTKAGTVRIIILAVLALLSFQNVHAAPPVVPSLIIAVGGSLAVNAGENPAVIFLWIGHGVLLSLTTFLWQIFLRPQIA
jgi:hypothetical protein